MKFHNIQLENFFFVLSLNLFLLFSLCCNLVIIINKKNACAIAGIL